MNKILTCIVCPLGCTLEVTKDESGKVSVSGNTCPRGAVYGETELTNPQRTVTSTVRCTDGTIISVKTDRPIAKDKMEECMKMINNCNPHLPISVGDVIIDDVFGAKLVATSNS